MQFHLVNLIIYSLVAVMSLFGLVGNVISAIVWTRPQMRSSSAILLTALAACDTVIDLRMLSRSIPGCIQTFNAYTNNSGSLLESYSKYYILPFSAVWVFPVFRMAITASTYLSLAITLERYIAVRYPFLFAVICSQRRAVASAAGIILFSILFNMCRFWENEVVPIQSGYKYVGLQLMRNKLYISIYRTWMHLIISFVLPLTGITVLNTVIFIQLRRVNRDESLSTLRKNENRLAVMLLYVVTEFLVCSSVTGFLGVWRTFGQYDAPLFGIKLTAILNPISLLFDTFNSSVNFLTYIIFWRPFRKTLMGGFGRVKFNLAFRRNHMVINESGGTTETVL